MLSAYVQKYGQQAGMNLLNQLPNLNANEIAAVRNDVAGAANEADSQNYRETYGAWSRAKMMSDQIKGQ